MRHVLVPRFGLDKFDDNGNDLRREAINKFILEFEDKVDSVTAKMLLRQIYQKTYELVPIGEQHHAKHLTALLPKEDISSGSVRSTLFRRYMDHEVAKYSLMSFDAFMEQPYAYCERMFKDILRYKQKEGAVTESTINKLDKLLHKK